MQFCGSFLNSDPNAVAVYLDTESASNAENPEVEDRIVAFGSFYTVAGVSDLLRRR